MDRKILLEKQQKILSVLSSLPQKMLSLHEFENMTEFVLYELSGRHCFDFHKAAFFVNNPDFNFLKGIAGVNRQEGNVLSASIWSNPETFSSFMRSSQFNTQVRTLQRLHGAEKKLVDENLVQEVAKKLGISEPAYCSLKLKNDNNGLLIFEHAPDKETLPEEQLKQGCALLGFCPIF